LFSVTFSLTLLSHFIFTFSGNNRTIWARVLRYFVYGTWEPEQISLELGGVPSQGGASRKGSRFHSSGSLMSNVFALGYCFLGLQVNRFYVKACFFNVFRKFCVFIMYVRAYAYNKEIMLIYGFLLKVKYFPSAWSNIAKLLY